MRKRLLENLESKIKGDVAVRRYSLPEIISESYKTYYACKEGSNIQKLAEAHLNDVRTNPTDIDRLSRQLCNVKHLATMVESRKLNDKELFSTTKRRRVLESKNLSRRRKLKESLEWQYSKNIDEYSAEISPTLWAFVGPTDDGEGYYAYISDDKDNIVAQVNDFDSHEEAKSWVELNARKGMFESKNISRRRKLKESSEVTYASLDYDKVRSAMESKGYGEEEILEFLSDEYGLEDGEDYQLGNGDLDFGFYKSPKADKCIKDLGESVHDEDVEQKEDNDMIDEAEEVELTDEEAEELAKHLAEMRKKKGVKESKKVRESKGRKLRRVKESAEDRVVAYGIDIINPPQDMNVEDTIMKAVEGAGLDVAGCMCSDTSWSAKEYGLSESKKVSNESKSWNSLQEGMKNFNKVSSNKAFYKTFKKMHEALKEGRALTRQESISLYKAANSAMTHLSVELEHNPEFLATFKECTSLLSTDVNSILGSLKEGKAPSKKTMKSLSKFAEALLREADEDEEDIPAIEDEEGESIDAEEAPASEEEEFVGDDEGDIVSEEEEEFDQEYADARVELHKELADKHEDDEDPGIQDKLAQDAEEVTSLPGITDEQVAEITGEEVDSEEEEEPSEEAPEEGESGEGDSEPEDDSDITDDELAELKKHLTEMRKAKKIRESKGRKLKRRAKR